ncbi:hypothetical protein FLCH110379_18950 [Flavobacterium chungbukense]
MPLSFKRHFLFYNEIDFGFAQFDNGMLYLLCHFKERDITLDLVYLIPNRDFNLRNKSPIL